MDPEPFSISCIYCDAGQGVESEREAVLAGWLDIEPDDGVGWNYLGVCPNPQCLELHNA